MLRATAIAILLAWGSYGTLGQSAPPAPAFEVASIKPAPAQAPGRVSTRMSSDAGRLTYTNVSLSDVIAQAYHVQHDQISGPLWLGTERFDIAAKIPAGAAADQIPQMLQALLADRFRLELHRETKVLTVLKLAVAKSGLKLQKAESSGGLSIGLNPGRTRVSGRLSMPQLADILSRRLGRPVLDQTHLAGAYVIALEWAPDSTGEPAPVDAPGASLFSAMQEQLGLKLAPAKGPVEILVIDRADKVPSEN